MSIEEMVMQWPELEREDIYQGAGLCRDSHAKDLGCIPARVMTVLST